MLDAFTELLIFTSSLLFAELVKTRHQKTQELMKHSASMSRAAAIETTMAHWWNGSPEGQIFSLVVASDGMQN